MATKQGRRITGEGMYAKGMHPGATWKKCDFQVHTPRDPNWQGPPNLPGGTDDLEQRRHDWADSFVKVCLAKKLDAIAITDHHDFTLIEYIRSAIKRLQPEAAGLWLFPGMEVTCDDDMQCLVLFDQNTKSDTWSRVFGGPLPNSHPADSNAAKSKQADGCGNNFETFYEKILEDKNLSGRVIIIPHASNDGSHKQMLRTKQHHRFRKVPFDGVYTEIPFSSLDPKKLEIIQGKKVEWGLRRRGVIPTGDNRKSSYENLGKNECWIRLGEPTTEAIRQSLLADQARFSYEQPIIPSQRIISLAVSSTLTGPNFELKFSDAYTALIGGRGSGKSAILEYLRFGLGRSSIDMATDIDDEAAFNRERQLIDNTLAEGSVEVTLERDGVLETWVRTGQQKDVITIRLPANTEEQVTIDAAQRRFPARAFYQKQLSTLINRKAAEDQITGIAAAELIESRRRSEQSIDAAKRSIHGCLQKLIEFWVAEAEHQQAESLVADLNRRIAAIKAKLSESGLSPEIQEILDAAPKYNSVESLIGEAEDVLVSRMDDLTASIENAIGIDTEEWGVGVDFIEVAKFIDATKLANKGIRKDVKAAIAKLKALEVARKRLEKDFGVRKKKFDKEHAQASTQQDALKSLLIESARLVAQLKPAEVAVRKAASRMKVSETAEAELTASRVALASNLLQRRDILNEAAAKIEAMSSGWLKASTTTEVQPKEYREILFSICDGLRIRDLSQKCYEKSGARVLDGTWGVVCEKLLSVLRHKIQVGSAGTEIGESVKSDIESALFSGMTQTQISGIYSSLNISKVAAVLSAIPEDFIVFEYRDKRTFIPFERASPGQQAAALLHLLLNQEAGTLIVDQPEEDLDSKVIMDIVDLLQRTKRKRQLVFASHSPNIVVIGDADKIVALVPGHSDSGVETMETPRIRVDADGAIETPEVRYAITETMEGGRAAFELRSRKYQF